MYTIGQVSQIFNLPISTLRYYDKEGLFPDLKRSSGIRQFDDQDLDVLNMIECLKKSGLEIKDIKQFMEWCSQGEETYQQRLELFQKQKQNVQNEIERLKQTQALIEFKCWYYETAIADGNEERLKKMKKTNSYPADKQELYDYGRGYIQKI